MSTLLAQIKKDRIQAMKDKDVFKKNILTIFIGNIETKAKDGLVIDDAYVVKQASNSVESAKEGLAIVDDEKYHREIEIFSNYIPQLATVDDYEAFMDTYLADESNERAMKVCMVAAKDHFGANHDGKTASQVVSKRLKG
jgi:uncharacterized protein YqeY